MVIIYLLLSFLHHEYLQENLPRLEIELQFEEFQREEEEFSKDNMNVIQK